MVATPRKRRARNPANSSKPRQATKASAAAASAPAASAATPHTAALVLADVPERNQLRELQIKLGERRDRIAELDLEIENLRHSLESFEGHYRASLAQEHGDLTRIERLVRHLERWSELLREAPRAVVEIRGKATEQRRARQIAKQAEQRQQHPEGRHDPAPALPAKANSQSDALKSAYRALARRFHPDLARSEDERVRLGEHMRRINELYRLGDLQRLQALAEQAKGADIDAVDLSVAAQAQVLAERLNWFDAVLENLREERIHLEASPTCELMRNVELAERNGRDLLAELQVELAQRVQGAFEEVGTAVKSLESEVRRYNREAGSKALELGQRHDLERHFDPLADKGLVRLGLEQLATLQVSRPGQALAQWLQEVGATHPALLRIVLFTYVSELSPYPLPGLGSYDDLELRFQHLGARDEAPMSLDVALVEADEVLEYGVRQANASVAHLGLRFRSAAGNEAVLVALKSFPVRREFRRVLTVLGEIDTCPACGTKGFCLPLFRLRGLDNLRATVCSECGHTLQSYWMPKGKDVQAVLNSAFLDFDIVSEWTFGLSKATVSTQLAPVQVDSLCVGDLQQRIFTDIFERHAMQLTAEQLMLVQHGEVVLANVPLGDIAETRFELRFTSDAEISEHDAAELLKHRIRNRFRT